MSHDHHECRPLTHVVDLGQTTKTPDELNAMALAQLQDEARAMGCSCDPTITLSRRTIVLNGEVVKASDAFAAHRGTCPVLRRIHSGQS